MKAERLAALAEIVSSVAIVVTLVYLAIQTEQNTAAIQSSVRQGMLDSDRESLYMAIDQPFLLRRTELDEQEQLQLVAFLTAFIRMRENYWIQFQNGALDEATWESYRGALIPVVFSSEFGRRVWDRQTANPETFNRGYVDAINSWVSGLTIEDSDTVWASVIAE